MTKIVSQVSSAGYFISATIADESPLESGVFLLPAGTVDVNPPSPVLKNKRYKLINSMWIQEDFIGPVPTVISKFQAKAALLLAGKLDEVESYMSSAPAVEKLAWDNVQEFKRNSPTLLKVANLLNMTTKEVDEMFISASQIEA